MKKKQAGFTLIETLLTLLIVVALVFLPIISIQQTNEKVQIDLFFRELTANITLMQNHAILAEDRTEIQFNPTEDKIRFKVHDGNSFSTHSLDREMQLDNSVYQLSGSGYKGVSFRRGTGNISIDNSDWWRINFDTVQGKYELVFQIGSGRFEIREK